MKKAFQSWRRRVGYVNEEKIGGMKKGEGERREKEFMELNIGAESGRFREYILRLKTFYKKALGEHSRKNSTKPQQWVP
eukprot:6168817-Pleurochrysis_carterae.AAC.2